MELNIREYFRYEASNISERAGVALVFVIVRVARGVVSTRSSRGAGSGTRSASAFLAGCLSRVAGERGTFGALDAPEHRSASVCRATNGAIRKVSRPNGVISPRN